MADAKGKFVWYDLMTTDLKAAESFYGSVVGWTAANSGMPDRTYILLSVGSTMVAGLMPLPENMLSAGARPFWTGYISVDDVDVYAERVKAAGGAIYRTPEDIPGVGRFAVAADPHGAGFILFKGMGDAPADVPAWTPGYIGWNELHAGEGESDFAFYSGLFGWTKAEAIDMGPMGVYQTFATGGAPVGGVMTKTPDTPLPMWLYYFNVDGVDAAVERVKAGGGQLLMGPHQVPGGSWIVQCFDPQGAMFALVGMTR